MKIGLVMELLKNWLRGPKDLDHFVSGGGSLGGSSVRPEVTGVMEGERGLKRVLRVRWPATTAPVMPLPGVELCPRFPLYATSVCGRASVRGALGGGRGADTMRVATCVYG